MQPAKTLTGAPPLVLHVLYRLDYGGMEKLLVDIVQRMPATNYRHALVCLCGHSVFASQVPSHVSVYDLNKPPGPGLSSHRHFYQLVRRLSPAIVHTYNIAGVEYSITAAIAGVPVRVHAEHGRHAHDILGTNPRHNFLRRRARPFVDSWVSVSRDLQSWLQETIGVKADRNLLVSNGVDTRRFRQEPEKDETFFTIGTVMRVTEVKNPLGLLRAFIRLRDLANEQERERLRLVVLGNGSQLEQLREQVHVAGLDDVVELPGAVSDVRPWLSRFSLFCLPSFSEGTPVAMLEAMACGLPVVATTVGGVPDLIEHGLTGTLISPGDEDALVAALLDYLRHPATRAAQGERARQAVQSHHSVDAMVERYRELYDELLERKTGVPVQLRRGPCAG